VPKMNRRLSSITTWRQKRPPENEQTSSHFTDMAPDYLNERSIVPSKVTGGNSATTRTMNSDGRAALPTTGKPRS
jgi:hypothetical protein